MLGNDSWKKKTHTKKKKKKTFLYQDGHHPPKMGTLSTANLQDINNVPILSY